MHTDAVCSKLNERFLSVCLCVCVGRTTVTELCRASGSVCLKLFTLTMQWCSLSGMIGRRVWGWFYLMHPRCCTSVDYIYKAISNANKTFEWFGWELRYFTQLPTFGYFLLTTFRCYSFNTRRGDLVEKLFKCISWPQKFSKNLIIVSHYIVLHCFERQFNQNERKIVKFYNVY